MLKAVFMKEIEKTGFDIMQIALLLKKTGNMSVISPNYCLKHIGFSRAKPFILKINKHKHLFFSLSKQKLHHELHN